MKTLKIGNISIGKTPRVVGCLSTLKDASTVAKMARPDCDIIEMRLDRIGPYRAGWMDNARRIEKAKIPVILTLRWSREGGLWTQPERERESILAGALETLSCVDIELASSLSASLTQKAHELGKCVIVSFHDFRGTPPLKALRDTVKRINDMPCAIPKIATIVSSDTDIFTLRHLLEAENERPLCVIGMGPLGSKTRLLFPSLGSCLAYGYLDIPAAPGQLRAAAIKWHLKGAKASKGKKNT